MWRDLDVVAPGQFIVLRLDEQLCGVLVRSDGLKRVRKGGY